MRTAALLAIELFNVLVVPLLLLGAIRKGKALMQNRVGAPLLQPFYDLAKLLRKGETISEHASWVFRWAPRLNLALLLLLALLVPWSCNLFRPGPVHLADFLLVAYLLALTKFISMLAAMDTASAFGGLGASREGTVSVLTEPALVLALASLALGAGSTDLIAIYAAPMRPLLAGLAGAALVVVALAELSRMPVDDPTTHLELTMIHEALILENSGRNLALTELAVALRTCVFLGLATQTLLRVWEPYLGLPLAGRYALGLAALFGAGALLALMEGVRVKLSWRRLPNFLAYGTTLSLMAALIAAAYG